MAENVGQGPAGLDSDFVLRAVHGEPDFMYIHRVAALILRACLRDSGHLVLTPIMHR